MTPVFKVLIVLGVALAAVEGAIVFDTFSPRRRSPENDWQKALDVRIAREDQMESAAREYLSPQIAPGYHLQRAQVWFDSDNPDHGGKITKAIVVELRNGDPRAIRHVCRLDLADKPRVKTCSTERTSLAALAREVNVRTGGRATGESMRRVYERP